MPPEPDNEKIEPPKDYDDRISRGRQEGDWLIYQPEFLFPGIQKDNIFYA